MKGCQFPDRCYAAAIVAGSSAVTLSLMSRPAHLPILVVLVAAFSCMAQHPETAQEVPTPPANLPRRQAGVVQELKPPSELALLMRTLAVHADSVKAALKRNDKLPPYPKEAKTLFTAVPTEGMAIDPITFPTFGHDYLDKLDALYKVPRKEQAQAYNALVQGCANCHTTHCPGPMMRIKKMYMPLAE